MYILILSLASPAASFPNLQNFIEVLAVLGCFATDKNDTTM